MKRLTFDGNFCEDVALCGEVLGGSFCEDGTCSQRQIWERLKMIEDVFGDEFDLEFLCELIKITREADVAPVVHGNWIRKGYVCGENEWECSNCGETEWRTSSSRMKYCMFCGAKMDLEE